MQAQKCRRGLLLEPPPIWIKSSLIDFRDRPSPPITAVKPTGMEALTRPTPGISPSSASRPPTAWTFEASAVSESSNSSMTAWVASSRKPSRSSSFSSATRRSEGASSNNQSAGKGRGSFPASMARCSAEVRRRDSSPPCKARRSCGKAPSSLRRAILPLIPPGIS